MSNRDRANKRARVVALLGSLCWHCGNPDTRVLQIDHRLNDGHKLKRGGRIRGFDAAHFAAIISGEDPIERYCLLCANCHQLKNKGFITDDQIRDTAPDQEKQTSGARLRALVKKIRRRRPSVGGDSKQHHEGGHDNEPAI